MLHKSKSKKINQLKYALVIPVLLGFLISCNTEVSDPTPESNALLPNVDVNPSSITIRHPANGFPLFIVDGKEIPHDEFEKLNEDDVFSINVLKDEKYTSKYGDKAKNGVVEIITKGNAGSFEGKPINGVKVIGFETKTGSTEKRIVVEGKLSNGENPIDFRAKPNSATTIGHKIEINKDEHPLVVVDGKELPFEDFERLDSDKVETMTFLKAENATKKYGNKAKNGVIEIITKK